MAQWISLLCAAFMLCVLPLLFHDALFDINRFKVSAVRMTVPVLCAAMAVACALKGIDWRAFAAGWSKTCIPSMCLLLFALACLLSSALAGFEHAVVFGDEGRYCGLWFMLACIAAFFVIGSGFGRAEALTVSILLCAAACALLGFVNMAGLDPLGFYRGMSEGQRTLFVSTIGHLDFFGTFLVMMFALAGGQCLFAWQRGMRIFAACCAAVIMLGASASRTDSAFLGVQLVCLALFAISGGELTRMSSAFFLWSLSFWVQPLTYAVGRLSSYHPEFFGVPLLVCQSGIAHILGAVLLAIGILCLLLDRKGVRAPGRGCTFALSVTALGLVAVLLFGTIVYFTLFDTQAELGSLSSFLRFDDSWGTLRGFVYIRSMRAYADFSIVQKLFGAGMELTQRILTPYFDNPEMLVGGIFNDTHCQPLQILLTCGLFGALTFVGFYLSMLWQLVRHAGDDPLLCGVLAALVGYSVIMLINVTQPILIATYFSICALAAARLRQR